MLTDGKRRPLEPRAKTYRVLDERGLYAEVPPTEGTHWFLKYQFAGREKRLSAGVYPGVSLATAANAGPPVVGCGHAPASRRRPTDD